MIRGPARGVALAAVLAAAAAPARADDRPPPTVAAVPAAEPPPEPAVSEAGEANLESIAPRQGFMFTAAFGGGLSIGLGMDNATGRGGAATFRLAHVANARTVFGVEIGFSALFFSVLKELYQTNVSNFLVAAQYYIGPALWIRGGAGLGRYGGDELRNAAGSVLRGRFRYAGPAASGGAGVDIIRLKRFRGSLEFTSTAMFNRDGILSSSGILFGLTID